MKILIINYRFLFSGGPERYMFNIIDELTKRDNEVITFSVANKNNYPSPFSSYFARNVGNSEEFLFEKYKKSPLFFYDFLTREFYSFYIRKKLRKLIRETKPEVCYLLPHKVPLSPSVIDELKKNNIPIVHRISDYNIICPSSGLYQNKKYCTSCLEKKCSVIKYKCIKNSYPFSFLKYLSSTLHRMLKLYDKVDHFITTNDFARERFIEAGFNEKKITTIRTFGKQPDKQPSGKPYTYTRPLQFVYVGNVDESKGLYDLIEACKQLHRVYSQTNFSLKIYGGLRDTENANIQDLINAYRLNANISLCGKINPDQIDELYQKADITVIPARWVENLPNVLIESLINCTPILVPDFGSLTACTSEDIAYYYSYQNTESLAHKMNEIISNPSAIKIKSLNCNNYVEQNFSKKQHVDRLLEIFNSIIK